MNSGLKKRFWKSAEVIDAPGGHAVTLDGRPVKTPARAPLVVPTRALAQAIADEWQAQGEVIKPLTMPMTRSANAALDKVQTQFDEVAHLITAYAETDLLCYRAQSPVELVARQAEAWDPLLAWSAGRWGVNWQVTSGVMPVAQDDATLAPLRDHVNRFTAFELTGFHDLVAMSGSLVIGLAVTEGYAEPDSLWALSRIDEDWQAEQWGVDDEAAEQAALKRDAFLHAAQFLGLCRLKR